MTEDSDRNESDKDDGGLEMESDSTVNITLPDDSDDSQDSSTDSKDNG
jgi:hypothetical protein